MKNQTIFSQSEWAGAWVGADGGGRRGVARLQAVHIDVHDRRGEQGEHLAKNEAANDGDAKGRRSSEPTPVPRASGSAPNSAAMVVMMIGRNRSKHAL